MTRIVPFILVSLFLTAGISFSAPGDLDTTFGGDGIVTYPGAADRVDHGKGGVAIQLDGKILVATGDSGHGTMILRYNADGTLDVTFGEDGVVTYYGDWAVMASGIAVQSDGKIVTASGYSILRYSDDGTPDNTFGENGAVTTWEEIRTVAIQPDGKIVAAGTYALGTEKIVMLVKRLNSDGTLDSAFGGGDGVITYEGADAAHSLALQVDGKIVVTGERWQDSKRKLITLRLNADGTFDTTFNGDGIAIYSSGNRASSYAIAVQPDGKIVVVGETYNPGNHTDDILVLRYNLNGTLDPTFSGDGIVTYGTHDIHGYLTDSGRAVAIQPDGKIVVVGETWDGLTASLLVLRFNKNGTLDRTFSGDGGLIYDSGMDEIGFGVALQQDGKIVVTGVTWNYPDFSVLTMRLLGAPPSLVLTRPNGGEAILAGSTYDISWEASEDVSYFELKYSIDNGVTWETIPGAQNISEDHYLWTIPIPTGNRKTCLMKVIGYDAASVRVKTDNSDTPFTIELVSITEPVAHEVVTKGSVYPVTWTTNVGAVSSAKVFYTFGSSGIWNPANGTVDDPLGSFSWNVPSPEKAKIVKLKVVLKDALGVTVGNAVSKAFMVR